RIADCGLQILTNKSHLIFLVCNRNPDYPANPVFQSAIRNPQSAIEQSSRSAMLKIGSRGSVLAQAQAQWVRRQVLDRFSDLEVTIQIFKTTGDQDAKASSGPGGR